MQSFIERRRQPRLNFTEPIQFRRLLKPEEAYSGSLGRDLSAGGLRIQSATPLAKDDRFVLLLALPDSPRVIRAISQVIWNSQRSFSSGQEAGLQFIEITSEDRDSIAGFVERGATPAKT